MTSLTDDKWRELAMASSWKWPSRFVTQYQFSVPVSDVEGKGMTTSELLDLILERVTIIAEEMEL